MPIAKFRITMLNIPLANTATPATTEHLSRIETDAVRVVVLRSLADIAQWGEEWTRLDQSSRAGLTYFQSYDWCSTWLKHHGNDVEPYVILVLRGTTLLAVWPLMGKNLALGFKVLSSLGEPHTQYSNILTHDGFLALDAIAAIKKTLAKIPGVDQLQLNYVPRHSVIHRIVPEQFEVSVLRNEAAHFCLQQFSSSADYRAQEGKSQRRMRKKATTLLSGLGEVRLEVLRPYMPQYAGMVAKCIAMKKMWLQRTGRIGMGLTHEDHEAFLSKLSGEKDGALLFVLMAGAKPVAFEFGLLQHGHYYSYLGSFAWGWRHASPGSLQIALTIDWLIDNGAATFDLLGNPENYKQTWTDVTVPLSCYVKSFSMMGALYGAVWTRRTRPALKALHKAMPAQWRSHIHLVRKLNLGQFM